MKMRVVSVSLVFLMIFSFTLSTSAMAANVSESIISSCEDEMDSAIQTVDTTLASLNLSFRHADDNSTMVFSVDATQLLIANLGIDPALSGSLTLGEGEMHALIFELSQNTIFCTKMTSENSYYVYQICTVVNDTLDEPVTDLCLAGNALNITLDAGTYAILVANIGASFGADYSIYVNGMTLCPANIESANVQPSPSYKHITVYALDSSGNNYIYCDGVSVYDETNTDLLNWKRELDLSWSSGYNYNIHEIFDARVSGVSPRITYTSNFVSSNNAIILYLDVGTGFMYNESKRNWNTGEHTFTYDDPYGNRTPRRLTQDDIENHQCWLVFDLNTGKAIDFWSDLNWYYFTNTETANYTLKADN